MGATLNASNNGGGGVELGLPDESGGVFGAHTVIGIPQ